MRAMYLWQLASGCAPKYCVHKVRGRELRDTPPVFHRIEFHPQLRMVHWDMRSPINPTSISDH